MNKKIQVSVVIPSYNSEKYIQKCLASLSKQKGNFKYEIIVVDSSEPSDSTRKIIKRDFNFVKLVELKKQTLPGEGRNIGIKQAKGKIIAFLDTDCVAREDWLNKAVDTVNQGYFIIGGAVRNANPGIISTADHILTFNEFLPGMPRREIEFMATCNLVCKKEIFKKIGGFPLDLAAGEDTIFCYNATKKYKILFNPDMIISHHNRTEFKKFMMHHNNFGKHSAMLRKSYALPGRIFARYPVLALLAPGARFIRILSRIISSNGNLWYEFCATSPIIFLGLTSWSAGFIQEGLNIRPSNSV
jgi:GT2 family glycosyltransferase